jgi:hypothetical protein
MSIYVKDIANTVSARPPANMSVEEQMHTCKMINKNLHIRILRYIICVIVAKIGNTHD